MTTENEQPMVLLGEMVAKVSAAMESAISEYGADAVDLALLAYQIAAIQYLVSGIALMVPLLFIGKVVNIIPRIAAQYEVPMDSEDKMFMKCLVGATYGVTTGIMFIAGVTNVISPAHWVAAFGRPELLIATKALQVAGLM